MIVNATFVYNLPYLYRGSALYVKNCYFATELIPFAVIRCVYLV